MGAEFSCKCNRNVDKSKELDFESEQIEIEEYEDEEDGDHIQIEEEDTKHKNINNMYSSNAYGSDPLTTHKKTTSSEIRMDIYEDDNFGNLSSKFSALDNPFARSKVQHSNYKSNKGTVLEVIREHNISSPSRDLSHRLSLPNLVKEQNEKEESEHKENQSPNRKVKFDNENEIKHINNKQKEDYYFIHKGDGSLTDREMITQSRDLIISSVPKICNSPPKKKRNDSNSYKQITKIIPEVRLLHCKDDDILYHSELKKILNHEVKSHFSQLYSKRFCILTKTEFRYYNSKEQFIRKQKPLFAVSLTNISKVSTVKLNDASTIDDHFFITIHEGALSPSLETSGWDTKSRKIGLLDMSHGQQHLEDMKILPMITTAKRNALIYNEENNESLLIFTSDKSELIKNWVVVLNYFIQI